jgi:hypothetical protein
MISSFTPHGTNRTSFCSMVWRYYENRQCTKHILVNFIHHLLKTLNLSHVKSPLSEFPGVKTSLEMSCRINSLNTSVITINKNTQTLIDASKEVGLEVNLEKMKYMLVSRDQNSGQKREIKIWNRSYENVSQFKYLGMTVTNQNLIQEEIKRRLNSGNACYQHPVLKHPQFMFLPYCQRPCFTPI